MTFQLSDNEFTIDLIIDFLNKYFGSASRGQPFSRPLIEVYIANGQIPIKYGGFRLYCKRYDELDGLRILTIPTLSRKEVIEWINEHPDGIVAIEKIAVRKWRAKRNDRSRGKRKERLKALIEEKRQAREKKKNGGVEYKVLQDDE